METKSFFLLLFNVAAISILCRAASNVTCHESERQALLSFKQDVNDPYNRLASWAGNSKDCCNWAGVVCDNLTRHVLELHLGNSYDANDDSLVPGKAYETSRLSGKVNPALLSLQHLRSLDLSGNNFGGQIPGFLSSFQNLKHLNLSSAGFEGLIPPQLGNLTTLRYLDLHDLGFYVLYAENLQWLSSLVMLEFLDLSATDLSKASDWLQVTNALPSLVELHLSSCQLDHLPPLLDVNFSSLAVLDLSRNKFSNSLIPSWVFRLKTLVSFDIGYNNFQGEIPVGLRNMTSLRYLSLASNGFNSSIPDWFYTLSHLEYLNLASNSLEGTIPNAIRNLTSLESLNLAYNELEGSMLSSLGSVCSLRELYMSGVQLGQDVSEILEILSRCISGGLQRLYLDGCEIYGHLTNQLRQFTKLEELHLARNSISGPVPESLKSLASLRVLDISRNQLNGTFPEWLGQLPELEVLWLSHNSLQGSVSEIHFSNATSLRLLQASGNSLTLKVRPNWVPPFQLGLISLSSWNIGPSFPSWLRFQKDFVYLDISASGIIDTIPDWFWNVSSQFFYLNLSHNQIRGKAPEIFETSPPLGNPSYIDLNSNYFVGSLPCLVPNVDTLDLSNNSFSGPISHFLCYKMDEPKNLANLHLADNHLSGEIPECWTNWPGLLSIDLKNNNLGGNIPSSIGSLNFLQSLHLRKNRFSGVLPLALQNCTELLALDLGENNLRGGIPNWIGERLSSLIILSLRSNNFQGQIPGKLCGLRYLTILDLAHNNMFGKIPKCFMNFSAMVVKQNSSHPIAYAFGHFGNSLETALLVIKGILLEYSTTLRLVTGVDLSDNNLSGEIPEEITSLGGLYFLNLSNNHLTGTIPGKIGNMGSLESLDLSSNQLSGEIPPSLSNLTFLGYLNLSNNNLTGKIPSSTQLQSFNASSYTGNHLCGPPVTESCNTNVETPSGHGREDNESGVDWLWFGVSMAPGFVVGFWVFVGPLLFSKPWRQAYFCKLHAMQKKLWGCSS